MHPILYNINLLVLLVCCVLFGAALSVSIITQGYIAYPMVLYILISIQGSGLLLLGKRVRSYD